MRLLTSPLRPRPPRLPLLYLEEEEEEEGATREEDPLMTSVLLFSLLLLLHPPALLSSKGRLQEPQRVSLLCRLRLRFRRLLWLISLRLLPLQVSLFHLLPSTCFLRGSLRLLQSKTRPPLLLILLEELPPFIRLLLQAERREGGVAWPEFSQASWLQALTMRLPMLQVSFAVLSFPRPPFLLPRRPLPRLLLRRQRQQAEEGEELNLILSPRRHLQVEKCSLITKAE